MYSTRKIPFNQQDALGRLFLYYIVIQLGERILSWKPEQVNNAIELAKAGYSNAEIAAELSKDSKKPVTESAVRHKLAREGVTAKMRKWNADGVQTSETILKVVKGQKMTPDDILIAHGYDPDLWEIVTARSNYWKSTEQTTNYQSRISVTPKRSVDPVEISTILNQSVQQIHVDNVNSGSRNLVIPLFDLHFGIMTYDLMKPYLEGLVEIVRRGYKHIVIEQGGDLIHSDYINKTMTVSGTQLDHADIVQAWQDAKKFYDVVINESLENSKRVSLYSIGGNHDYDMAWAFADGLADRWPQVDVHNSNEYRQAYQIDNVGIMVAHGDTAVKKLPMLFATEYAGIWSETNYREAHTGHFHKEVTNDDFGVVSRQFGTPKINDKYEKTNGYTMASRKLQVLEYSSDTLKAVYNV